VLWVRSNGRFLTDNRTTQTVCHANQQCNGDKPLLAHPHYTTSSRRNRRKKSESGFYCPHYPQASRPKHSVFRSGQTLMCLRLFVRSHHARYCGPICARAAEAEQSRERYATIPREIRYERRKQSYKKWVDGHRPKAQNS
jgi:hypothetical protein